MTALGLLHNSQHSKCTGFVTEHAMKLLHPFSPATFRLGFNNGTIAKKWCVYIRHKDSDQFCFVLLFSTKDKQKNGFHMKNDILIGKQHQNGFLKEVARLNVPFFLS